MTDFEKAMLSFLQDAQNEFNSEKEVEHFIEKHAPKLMEAARKQLTEEIWLKESEQSCVSRTTNQTVMNKFKEGDMLVVLKAANKDDTGRVGRVIKIEEEEAGIYYYWLDVIKKIGFREDNVDRPHGADLIREERRRQIEVEGYDAKHDRHHTPQVLCRAAVCYALRDDHSQLLAEAAASMWPWTRDFWKPKDQLRNLVRAGALIAAAIDRLQHEQE